MTDADLIFLPWVRRGAASAVGRPDPLGPDLPGVASTTATVRLNAAEPIRQTVRVMGPGHALGLQPGQIIRTDPVRYSRSFEANYFPLIEFDEPSLPWLFTPATANNQRRLRPWLCLVVIGKQEGVRLDPPRLGSLPILRIGRPADPAAELPDLNDSWAWAHAQVTAERDADQATVRALLDERPERSLSRLVCGRILAPHTEYLACVVPTFELGRRAGLGLEITSADESRLDPAWTLGPELTDVELPVYHHWEFATADGGDFQSLALMLKARPLPEGVGRRPIDVSASGVDSPVPPGTELGLGGALRPIGSAPAAWPSEAAHRAFQAELAELLNAPDALGPDNPLLAPPRYGSVQSGLDTLHTTSATRWYEQLNLDPLARIAAAFGTQVIQEQQEALVAAAWQQTADLRAANRIRRHAQLGRAMAGSLLARHLSRMAPDTGLQVIAPAQARLSRIAEANRTDTGLVALLAATGLPPSAFGTPLRRIGRPQGAINRRLGRLEAQPAVPSVRPVRARTNRMLTRLAPAVLVLRRRVVEPGPATIERVARTLNPPRDDLRWGDATAVAVHGTPPRPEFRLEDFVIVRDPPPSPDPPLPPPILPPPRDSREAAAFRRAAERHLTRFDPPRPPPVRVPAPKLDLSAAFDESLILAAPATIFVARIVQLIHPGATVPTDDDALVETLLSPYFPQPMSTSLNDLGQHLLLPGLDGVPPNTVVPLETDSAFVAAFMAGLNHEFGRELLWREFPAVAGATFFDRFFDNGVAPAAEADVAPIAAWGDRELKDVSGGPERFVMLIRSELLRRYPHAVIYAVKPGADPSAPGRSDPIFAGGMEPDVRYFGFNLTPEQFRDWTLVIQEQPTAPRFGVEVDTDTGAASHLPVPAGHAAEVAQRLRQTPVRISIPATVLLGAG
jgi:hypothetical protein